MALLNHKGDHDRAIADYNEAIRLNPKYSDAFNSRGNAYRSKGDLDRAIADYSEAIQLDPKFALAYRNRGFVHFSKHEFPAATADLLQSIKLKNDAYSMLWQFLARSRDGDTDATELATSAVRLKSTDWPYPVIEFYLGKRSGAEMSAAATKPEERCEAQFYLGEWHLLRRDRAAAATALRMAVDTCPKTLQEYDGAVAELQQLGQQGQDGLSSHANPPKGQRPASLTSPTTAPLHILEIK